MKREERTTITARDHGFKRGDLLKVVHSGSRSPEICRVTRVVSSNEILLMPSRWYMRAWFYLRRWLTGVDRRLEEFLWDDSTRA